MYNTEQLFRKVSLLKKVQKIHILFTKIYKKCGLEKKTFKKINLSQSYMSDCLCTNSFFSKMTKTVIMNSFTC